MVNKVKTEPAKISYSDFTEEELEILKTIPDTGKIRNHLERFGNITSLEAINLYGIQRLSSVIYRLRYEKEPLMEIDSVPERGLDRFGQTANYVRYIYKGDKEI